MRRFDQQALQAALGRIGPKRRAAFAAACAQRLAPSYSRFWAKARVGEKSNEVSLALQALWDDLAGTRPLGSMQLKALIDRIRLLVPDEDEAALASEPSAEDAVEAVVYALTTRHTGGVESAVWAARCAYEAVDNEVSSATDSIAFDEDAIAADPRVQRELEHQERDIRILVSSRQESARALIESIRESAAGDFRGS